MKRAFIKTIDRKYRREFSGTEIKILYLKIYQKILINLIRGHSW